MKIKAPQLKSDCLELFYKVCSEDIPMPFLTVQAKTLVTKNLAEWLKDEKLLRVTWYGGQALTELVLPDRTEKPEQGSLQEKQKMKFTTKYQRSAKNAEPNFSPKTKA